MMEYISDRVKNNLPEAYVFINPHTGRHYAETTLKRVWDNIKKKAGIVKSFRLYDATRHSFGSQLVDMGSSPYKVSTTLATKKVTIYTKTLLFCEYCVEQNLSPRAHLRGIFNRMAIIETANATLLKFWPR